MVKKKTVERTKKKITQQAEIINEIIINVNNPQTDTREKKIEKTKQEKKVKAKKSRRFKKLKSIKLLKEKLEKFRELKELAKSKNIALPARLGESPSDMDKINSVKEISLLTKEIDNRNIEIEGIIEKGQQGQQPPIQPQQQNLMAGVFPASIEQQQQLLNQQQFSSGTNIIPNSGRFQPPIQPPIQPQSNMTDFNSTLQNISNKLLNIKSALKTLMDVKLIDTDGFADISQVEASITVAEKLDQNLLNILIQLDNLKKTASDRDKITLTALENDYDFEVGEISVNGITNLVSTIKEYLNILNEWKDDHNEQVAGGPSTISNTGSELTAIQKSLLDELNKEGKPIPEDITNIQTSINNLKMNANEYGINVEKAVKNVNDNPTALTLKKLKTLTDNPPPIADEELAKYIYKTVRANYPNIKILKIAPTADTVDTPDTPELQRIPSSVSTPDTPAQIARGTTVLNVSEPFLNGKTVPMNWYNNYINWRQFIEGVKFNMVNKGEGFYQLPEDKVASTKTELNNLEEAYKTYREGLDKEQIRVLTTSIPQFDKEILSAGKTDFKVLIKEILQGDAKTRNDVKTVIIGDKLEDVTTRVVHQRYSSGGDFEKSINADRKQLLRTTDPAQLQQLINVVERQQLQAERTFNSLGENEISVINDFKKTISKYKQLIEDISKKIEESNNPPAFIDKETSMRGRGKNDYFLVRDGGSNAVIHIDDNGVFQMSSVVSAP